jgi:hypothetical protein
MIHNADTYAACCCARCDREGLAFMLTCVVIPAATWLFMLVFPT